MSQQQPEQQPQRPKVNYDVMTEYFADLLRVHINAWSAVVDFGIRGTQAGEDNKVQARVRMPLSQAKVLALLALRQIREYEVRSNITVDLPNEVLQQLGIPPEDWRRFDQPN